MADIRKAYVYVQKNYTGILKETDEGYVFTYDMSYLSSENALPVSITLPLRMARKMHKIIFWCFGNA